ncbi:MAG: OmpA family protein [Crocinitomicaceae bacterium]|nr:OmpA family protein [Crocinitomicaceae bacterium]
MRLVVVLFLICELNVGAVIHIDSLFSLRYSRTINDSVFVQGDLLLSPEIRFDLDNGLRVDEGASESIRQLARFFTLNPFLIVEIISHSDSRGSTDTNQSLSLQRSKSIIFSLLNYFESDTVFSERFTAVGKGESDPIISEGIINQYKNDKILFERYHQVNRRTEIKVTGFIGKEFYKNKRASKSLTVSETRNPASYNDLVMIADRYLLESDLEST